MHILQFKISSTDVVGEQQFAVYWRSSLEAQKQILRRHLALNWKQTIGLNRRVVFLSQTFFQIENNDDLKKLFLPIKVLIREVSLKFCKLREFAYLLKVLESC